MNFQNTTPITADKAWSLVLEYETNQKVIHAETVSVISEQIIEAAKSGKKFLVFEQIFPTEVLQQLKNLGYDILVVSNRNEAQTEISWKSKKTFRDNTSGTGIVNC